MGSLNMKKLRRRVSELPRSLCTSATASLIIQLCFLFTALPLFPGLLTDATTITLVGFGETSASLCDTSGTDATRMSPASATSSSCAGDRRYVNSTWFMGLSNKVVEYAVGAGSQPEGPCSCKWLLFQLSGILSLLNGGQISRLIWQLLVTRACRSREMRLVAAAAGLDLLLGCPCKAVPEAPSRGQKSNALATPLHSSLASKSHLGELGDHLYSGAHFA
jgi:hypothetical protein